jgi:MFS family permease
MLYAGSIIGFFLIPYVSDNFGRLLAIRTSWGLLIIGILCISMAGSSITIGIGQFLCGFGCNPAISLCYSFLN